MKKYVIVTLFAGLITMTLQFLPMEDNSEKCSVLRAQILKMTENILCNKVEQHEVIKSNIEKAYQQLINLLQIKEDDKIIEEILLEAKDNVSIEGINLTQLTKKRVKDYCYGVIDDISDTDDEESYLRRNNFFSHQSIVARLYEIYYQLNPDQEGKIISVNAKKELKKARKLLRIKAAQYQERMEAQKTVLSAKLKESNDLTNFLIQQRKLYELDKSSLQKANAKLQSIQSSLPKDKELDSISLTKLRKSRENINRLEKKCESHRDDEKNNNKNLKEADEELHRIKTSLAYLETDLQTVAQTPQDIVKTKPSYISNI